MKFFYTILILFICFTSFSIQASEQKTWVAPTQNYKQDFLITKNLKAVVQIESGFIVVKHQGKTQKIQDIQSDTFSPYQGKIFVNIADYNFDGYQDIEVYDSFGYMGVNIFSQIYSYHPDKKTFEKMLKDCNIRLDVDKKQIHTSGKSGPKTFQKIYKFKEGQMYLEKQLTFPME